MTLGQRRWSAFSSWTGDPTAYMGQWGCSSLGVSSVSLQGVRGFSKPSDRPSLGPWPGCGWHVGPMGTGIRPMCWQRGGCGRAGGTPALIHGWKQFECRQLPSPESISGLFLWQGIKSSGPFCWGWFCLKPKPLDLRYVSAFSRFWVWNFTSKLSTTEKKVLKQES